MILVMMVVMAMTMMIMTHIGTFTFAYFSMRHHNNNTIYHNLTA